MHDASKYVETSLALADTAMFGSSALVSTRQPLDCVLVVRAVLPRALPGSRGGDARGDDWVPGRRNNTGQVRASFQVVRQASDVCALCTVVGDAMALRDAGHGIILALVRRCAQVQQSYPQT